MTVEQQRDWTVWLHQQRRIVIRVSIGFILVLGFIGLVFDGIKQISTGTLSFNFTYYLLSYLAILALQLVPRIPDQWRSVGFLLVLYTFGVLSLFSGWLASSGRVFLLALVVVTVVLLSPWASSIAAALVLVTYVLFGLAFNQGWISLRQLPDPTSLSPVLLEGIGFAIGILLVSISLWYFGRALMAADRANHEAQDTRRLLDVRASQLEAANALIAQQAEAALQDSEAKFRNVIQQANDSIILCDEHGKITVWNLAAEQITGLASEQVIGRLLWEVQAEMLTIPDGDPPRSSASGTPFWKRSRPENRASWTGCWKGKSGARTPRGATSSSWLFRSKPGRVTCWERSSATFQSASRSSLNVRG